MNAEEDSESKILFCQQRKRTFVQLRWLCRIEINPSARILFKSKIEQ